MWAFYVFLKNRQIEIVLVFKLEIPPLLSFILKVTADCLVHGLSVEIVI